ncbi:MAG: Riboflavin biosynthesis protein RibF [Chlamydiae bacterium]|nr:Riboflavin biosynthesis protein RibF [Chlamydiota bacterium]
MGYIYIFYFAKLLRMIVLEKLSATYSPARPCGFAIGSFDGVHIGHQKILQKLREKVGPKGCICVLTFSNHPSHVLPGKEPAALILSKGLKLEALEKCGVDLTYCIPFTLDLAAKSYAEFLQELMQSCPFDFLVLGEGACLGKKREGTPEKVSQLGKQMGFAVEYIPKILQNASMISSGKIREHILSGNLSKAAELLGRPFAIDGEVKKEQVFIPPNFCLPPDGKYSVYVNNTKRETILIRKRTILLQSAASDRKICLIFC